ncbi:MAG: ATP-binding cassette domain-containing protein [Clostridiales bacterium]|nr:ATP-binding cassette domain-containing protein [Candidatus Scatonaster coprocaballi]
MNSFEEQLRKREVSENADFEDAIDSIANAVMGRRLRDSLSQREIAGSAMEEILKYYHCKSKNDDFPPQIKTLDEQIEYRMRPFGIKSRAITLDKGWYHQAVGAMLGTLKEDGSAVALIPGNFSGYRIVHIASGRRMKLNKKTEKLLDKEAVCFYEPLPQKSLTVVDLLKFMVQQLSVADAVLYMVLMVLSAALGLLSPMFTKWLFSDVLEYGNLEVLISLAVFVVCFSISQLCFKAFQELVNARIGIKQSVAVQAAVMNRIMSLPTSFFKQYSAGELSQRASYVQSLCSTLFSTIGITGLSSLFSLMYIAQIFVFAPSLVVPSLVITAATIALSLLTTFSQIKITREKMELSAKTSGMTYSMIKGIQKIKLAGAEKRMFSRWARHYAKEAQLEYNPPMFLKLSSTFSLALSLCGTLILYTVAVENHIAVADYYAFNTAYGMVSSAFMAVASIAITVANIRPTLEMARPIMEAEPERHDKKETVVELDGEVELSHVSFRYNESSPNVINDVSLKIHPGEYLAIVGATGCGKTTLFRLLLGFETPQMGNIFFDKKNVVNLDLESLRRKIGVVMQDSSLFIGDIYSNIIITSPQLRLDEAWEAAEIASVADDIRRMPMGMHTQISEGQGGISGGQKQRLMIARAVASKPRILMFDEATSALDNLTQKKVSEAIDSLNCTRIVIAHRLSTIQHADRIIFLEKGVIAEEGTYEELIAKNGRFAELVERQRLDAEEFEHATVNK